MTRDLVDAADRAQAVDFTYEDQVAQWENVPVEGSGYVRTSYLLSLADDEILRMARLAESIRYATEVNERNEDGRWRRFLHGDVAGKHVLDFGCGFGLESLQMARAGARITVADIHPSNVRMAQRLLGLHGYTSQGAAATSAYPYVTAAPSVDIFYSCGSLHHLTYPRQVLLRACELLAPGGEIRLMLYTDEAWTVATGKPAPPVDDDTAKNPDMPRFRCTFDSVGYWADWYSRARLEHRFGDFLDVRSFEYLQTSGVYAAATLVPR